MVGIRCFIGFFVPEGIRGIIVGFQRAISALPAICKMVEPENLHVCLSFIGDVSESELDSISESLEGVCSGYGKFEVDAGKIKLIPDESYIRVVVLEVGSKSESLERVSGEIKDKVGGSVKPPHITLCRVKRIYDKGKFVEVSKSVDASSVKFQVGSIAIIKSELSPSGPTYSIVKDVPLSA